MIDSAGDAIDEMFASFGTEPWADSLVTDLELRRMIEARAVNLPTDPQLFEVF